MPELPEVETMRRGIAGAVGSNIIGARRVACRRKPILISPRIDAFQRRVVGQQVTAVDRAGKRVVVRLSGDDSIVFEPRMTGLVLVADPPTREHLRFELRLSGGELQQICFWDRRGLGSVRLLSPRQFEQQLGPASLGPDALSVTPDGLRDRFHASRREIKTALLDQRALAGIGNLYASEILHLAGIHPRQPCQRLSRKKWNRLHEAMTEILNKAIRYEGSTLSDGTYRNALNESGGYQNHHAVYDREGGECPRCAGAIKRIVQAQRSTFFCPSCQSR